MSWWKSRKKLEAENAEMRAAIVDAYILLGPGPCEVMNCLGCETDWAEVMRLLQPHVQPIKSESSS